MSGFRNGREVVRELEHDGWTVTPTKGGHYRATHPDAPGQVMYLSQTPSGKRHPQNVRAMARRLTRREH
jgi:predicted RNA binding protein YcfA (HicA-like mRNA interferase family)